uniref:Uncharacterized protein n=1 Tax=Myoviridae sp. ct3wi9 TaxID=2826610 RepID=A0A8S5MWL4_9CAUD|nr:MAG TPA: hypothetical protein [Myoviridae sp. ct3wi9]
MFSHNEIVTLLCLFCCLCVAIVIHFILDIFSKKKWVMPPDTPICYHKLKKKHKQKKKKRKKK